MMADDDNPSPEEIEEQIIDNLENIKTLLDEDEEATSAEKSGVPLLNDPIESQRAAAGIGLADNTFNALLGDGWRTSMESMFDSAKSQISERTQEAWQGPDGEALASALKQRIDQSVTAWLGETLAANIGVLRERIIKELSQEIIHHLESEGKARRDNTDG